MNDGVELVIADCHLGGKIAFHEQRGCWSSGRGPLGTLVRTGRGASVFACPEPWFAGELGEHFGCGRNTAMALH
jgi:hypothetical protein